MIPDYFRLDSGAQVICTGAHGRFRSSAINCGSLLRFFIACGLMLLPIAVAAQNSNQPGNEIDLQLKQLFIEGSKREEAGDYDAAIRMFQQALDIAEKNFGPEHTWTAFGLDYLGEAYFKKGDVEKSIALLDRSIKIFSKEPEYVRSPYAKAVQDLGFIYDYQGDYSRAEPLYDQALALFEADNPEQPQVGQTLNLLGNVYLAKGDYKHAEQVLQRALAVYQKKYPADHPRVTIVLNNLALAYDWQGNTAKAEEIYKQLIAIAEKRTDDSESTELAYYLNNLGTLYRTQSAAKARPLLERALAIREKKLGPNNEIVANTLNNLAMADWQEGNLKQAEERFLRALGILQQTVGPAHPDFIRQVSNLAFFYAEKGEMARAINLLKENMDNGERNMLLKLAIGSEDEKRIFMASISEGTSGMVSLHLKNAPNNVEAAQLALTTILRRKGRVLDVMSGQIASLVDSQDASNRELLNKLGAARAQLASLVLKGAEGDSTQYKAKVDELQREIQSLERKVSEKATAMGSNFSPVRIEAVQAMIPENAALVEMIQYKPVTMRVTAQPTWEADRYAAYVLMHTGPPTWVDLGEAAKIDADAMKLRSALRNPRRTDFSALSRAVDEEVMRPVRKLLGNIKQVFISPDGALNLIPYAALIDEQNHILIENYTLTYLTSGRDLLRLNNRLPSKQAPVLVANPLFAPPVDAKQAATNRGSNSSGTGRRAFNFSESFNPLAGTSEEAKEVSTILSGAKVFTGAQATESTIKQVKGPSILHIATHGFFLPKPAQQIATTAPELSRGLGISSTLGLITENPLLRSGIALTGANELNDGQGEDGILTALEASGLDLHGTKLVVLSACETGVGDVQNGDGVYGLRRALALAGAESQLMTLWKVDDDATRELMIDYYKKLKEGAGRSEALRQVQLKLLKSEDHKHPFFWAAFILSGDWRPVS